MCGIVGTVLAQADREPDVAILRRMADRIRHRGPDDEGFMIDGPAGLGMRRLRVIDLETGRQPMSGEDRSIWTVFNGEIYNYRELTAWLTARGHTFATRSDTEVIVHGWEEQGVDVLGRLEGMFAIAVWDRATRTLHLVRDRLGIKPLYYTVLPGALVFASELRALLEHPDVGRELDVASLARYLAHEYVPAPHAIIRGVRKLPAGHWLAYRDGHAKVEPYWDVPLTTPRAIGETEALAELRDTIDASVRQHLVSDVPLGVFLSGGIDSSAVASFAAPHVGGRLSTFSIGFDDPSFDESAHARRVAEVLGTEHHTEVLGARAGLELVERLPDLLDEPLGDASLLPTYLLSRFARRSVTVALSGDGGDEVFAGYPTYPAHAIARVYERVPALVRDRIVRPLVNALPVSFDDLSVDFRLKRFVAGIGHGEVDRHAIWMGAFTPAEQSALMTGAALDRMGTIPAYDTFHELATHTTGASSLARIQYLDLKGYLGEGVLTKVDRASMACSLEVRVPLLDRRVVELAFRLPDHLKLEGWTTKYILRRLVEDRLPRAIVGRRKKGFGVPLARWFRGELRPLLGDVLAPDAIRRAGLFRPSVVTRLIAEHERGEHDHRKKLYTLLAFQLWASRYRPR